MGKTIQKEELELIVKEYEKQPHKPTLAGLYFLLYRKFLKLSEIVYNRTEIKNSMTKERREHFAMTLPM